MQLCLCVDCVDCGCGSASCLSHWSAVTAGVASLVTQHCVALKVDQSPSGQLRQKDATLCLLTQSKEVATSTMHYRSRYIYIMVQAQSTVFISHCANLLACSLLIK